MIDVKAIRSAKPQGDPADPLGLRETPEPSTRFLSSWAATLVGVGLYIRSFLWHDTEILESSGPPPKDPATDPAPTINRQSPAATAPSDSEPEADDTAGEAAAVDVFQLPVILGPLRGGAFAVPPLMAAEPFSANSALPPFASATGRAATLEGTPVGSDATVATILPEMDQLSILPDTPPGDGAQAPEPPAREPENVIRPDFGGTRDPNNSPAPPQEPDPDPAPTEPPPAETETPDDGDGPDDPDATDGPDRNRAPRNAAPVILGDVGSAAALVITLGRLLSQTSDEDGDALDVTIDGTAIGAIDQRGDGWRYLADADHLGEVRIDYTVSDGTASVAQTAILNIVENTFTGTTGEDLIVGTQGRDAITGSGGSDILAGLGGRDRIFGGDGGDNIAGGDGDDILHGGRGADIIVGGSGNDLIFGGAGDDRLYGADGDDVIHGDDGADLIDGGAGDDLLQGDAGADTLTGDAGQDTLRGGRDGDVLSGGTGDDLLSGDDGDDLLAGDEGADVIYGGAGHDTVSGGQQGDVVFGGAGDDSIAGDAGDDVLSGDGGDDLVTGGDGDDILSGGAGADTVAGGAGRDTVLADDDRSADRYDGGEDADVLSYADASEAVTLDLMQGVATGLSIGTDSIVGFETFVGSTRDDNVLAADGTGVLTGNGGADLYEFVQGDTVDAPPSIYQITDFGDDDRIWISRGDVRQQIRREQQSLEDRLEDGIADYAEDIGADEPRLVFHHDWTESYRRTVIDVDFDRDDSVDLSIIVSGETVLLVEHA